MTRKKAPNLPLRLDNDSERMIAAIDWAEEAKLPVMRKTAYQLKIGPLNFYPDTGSFYEDGARAVQERGFAAFKIAVQRWLEGDVSHWR